MAQSTWTIDASHTGIHFIARHLMFTKVHGAFKSFQGTLELDETDLTKSTIDVTIDATSVDTGEEKRDAHLRSADFFDTDRYPSLTFKSKKIAKKGNDYLVTGDLTIHGVTKEVVLDAQLEGKGKDPWGNEKIAFSAKTSVKREEYGLEWNQLLEAGGVLVGSKIEIELDVQAVRSQSSAKKAS